ncbi:hypothetical protein SAMN02927923_03993 [Microvirga guangxiensis]|uniref:Uncharacterized protein n=1 Tax=Microvirga guangxiensis TaxID=549386 RepID=A0A1G5L7K2_9HYPH|nr:hypothetical protein SAMN02927923_03993 [Microvirga guangxiensis]
MSDVRLFSTDGRAQPRPFFCFAHYFMIQVSFALIIVNEWLTRPLVKISKSMISAEFGTFVY